MMKKKLEKLNKDDNRYIFIKIIITSAHGRI